MSLVRKDSAFLRENLDLLFVALNPPVQSNSNGHYFSGMQSLFFKQLYESGLITFNLDKSNADEIVFGSNHYNYRNAHFGVVDLVPDTVETNSGRVRITATHVAVLVNKIKMYKPRNACIIHGKVKKALEKRIGKSLVYGLNGKIFDDCNTTFYCNYFPNGNSISTDKKLEIYRLIKSQL